MNRSEPRSSSPRRHTQPQSQSAAPDQQLAAYRILDANLNRCVEGLRVVEEYLRFSLEDAYLAGVCKQLRHDVASWATVLSVDRLHTARDTAHDVGTSIQTAAEYQRSDLLAVAVANCKRVQQALRSLEEYAKVVSSEAAARVEPLRYRAYMLERATTITLGSLERLKTAQLYVLLDGRGSLEQCVQLAQRLIQGSIDVLQLRDKRLSDRELLQRAHALRQLTRRQGVLLITNDRPDLAILADADGVHLGQQDMSVREARRIVGTERLIGVSTHTIEQARQAVADGADYLGCGPTFPSATKSFDCFAGLDLLRKVHGEIRLPAFAIGGIDADNLSQIFATGARRVATRHAIANAEDPLLAAHLFRKTLNRFPLAEDRQADQRAPRG